MSKEINDLTNQIFDLTREELGFRKAANLLLDKASEISEEIRKLKLVKEDLQQQEDAENMGHPKDY